MYIFRVDISMKSKILIFSFLFLLLVPQSAGAITALDVMEKMSKEERFSYITGLVDMLSYQSILAKNKKRAECIATSFYKSKDMQRKILNVFGRYPNKAPEGLVILLMNKACSK
jgi:hypothetical protein